MTSLRQLAVLLLLILCGGVSGLTVEVRIKPGSGDGDSFGTIEVRKQDGYWGTVCDDDWDIQDAKVVCRMLGFRTANASVGAAQYGQGSGHIWLDEIACSGLEGNIGNCGSSGWRTHDCSHEEDAGVRCNKYNESPLGVRLVGGTYNAGRLQVRTLPDGVWGTVCNHEWSDPNAQVVCKKLGFSSANVTADTGEFGSAEGPIVLDYVKCAGHERDLHDCASQFQRNRPGRECSHSQDVVVACTNSLEIRLAGGTYYSGRVEAKLGSAGQWGTICNRGWDLNDAHVVCQMIGFASAKSVTGAVHDKRTNSRTMWLNDVQCNGTERSLGECRTTSSWRNNSCAGGQDAQVVCTSSSSVAVRLAGGTYRSGRVEVKLGSASQWGTICNRGWDIQDATVVCSMIGFTSAESASGTVRAHGGAIQPIWLDSMQCNGTEESIEECETYSWGAHNCETGQNSAMVVCTNSKIEVRLEGGSFSSGRVEVRSSNSSDWGTVCNRGWDMDDANVVCRMLGFTSAEASVTAVAKRYGQGSGPIWLDNVQCTGSELSLHACPIANSWGTHGCSHDEDAGVICTRLEVRLAGNKATDRAGRVEVRRAGTGEDWGTVCDDGWTINEAHVVCRMRGYRDAEKFIKEAGFGSGTTSIYMDEVSCSGTEMALDAGCSFNSWGVHDCGHSEDVGVICTDEPVTFSKITSSSPDFTTATSVPTWWKVPQLQNSRIERPVTTLETWRTVRRLQTPATSPTLTSKIPEEAREPSGWLFGERVNNLNMPVNVSRMTSDSQKVTTATSVPALWTTRRPSNGSLMAGNANNRNMPVNVSRMTSDSQKVTTETSVPALWRTTRRPSNGSLMAGNANNQNDELEDTAIASITFSAAPKSTVTSPPTSLTPSSTTTTTEALREKLNNNHHVAPSISTPLVEPAVTTKPQVPVKKVPQCTEDSIVPISPATGEAEVNFWLDRAFVTIRLNVGQHSYQISSESQECHMNITVYDPQVVRRLLVRAEYKIACGQLRHNLTRVIIYTRAETVGYTQIEGLCGNMCKRQYAVKPGIMCSDGILTVDWPTDVTYDGTVSEIPPTVQKAVNEKIRKAGQILGLIALMSSPPIIYPMRPTVDGSRSISLVLDNSCTTGKAYNAATKSCVQ